VMVWWEDNVSYHIFKVLLKKAFLSFVCGASAL
jgi:hypothetical protein